MASYTNLQLNTLYTYIGYNFYLEFDPEISSIITATQAVSDGGQQPDDSLQLKILSICNQLSTTIDCQLNQLAFIDFVTESSKGSQIDPARGDFLLRKQGRALIKQLCIILGIKGVRQDYYSKAIVMNNNDRGMSYFPSGY